MDDSTHRSLDARLKAAEAVIDALRDQQVDAIVGREHVSMVKLRETEEALRRSEARYRAIVEDQTELICRWTPGHTLVFVNEAFCRFFGHEPVELLGHNLLPLAAPEGAQDPIGRLGAHHPMGESENIVIVKNGERRWVHWTHRILVGGDGAVLEGQSVGRDVTARRAAEDALQQAQRTLELQVAARTALAEQRAAQLQALAFELTQAEDRERGRIGQVLHDGLQQLLVAANLQVGFLQQSKDPEDLRQGHEKLRELIQESLAATRSLTLELSPPALNLHGLTGSLRWFQGKMRGKYDLEVDLELDDTCDSEPEPAQAFIFQAIRELLFNVVRHSGVKHARVALTCEEGSVTAAVSDEGGGFDPDQQRPWGGEHGGLGLFSLMERATFLGGSLTVRSAPGQGTTVTLRLPARQCRSTKAAQATAPAVADPESLGELLTPRQRSSGRGEKIRLLLVDDHSTLRQGLARLLQEQEDLEVVGEAADGREALLKVARAHPDVVIMDIAMEGMSGLEATMRIRTEYPDVQVVGFSMLDAREIADQMHRAGANKFVNKTESPEHLLRAIREAVAAI